ncbi:hypothetical protein D918_04112 [Trichuris suis]|nr:hypothetical protein D918_04112 [Trichuris suis]
MEKANPKGLSVSTTLVISFHHAFITSLDRAFNVQCSYVEEDLIMTQNMDVSCSKDNFILTDLSYLGDMEAGVESHIFKFADKPHVYFTCQVRLLIKREQPSQVCPKPICSFPSNPRNKRDLSKANTNSILGAIPKSRSTDIDIMASPILVLDLDLQHQNVVRGLSRSSAETETTSAEEYTYQKKKQTVCMMPVTFAVFLTGMSLLMLTKRIQFEDEYVQLVVPLVKAVQERIRRFTIKPC